MGKGSATIPSTKTYHDSPNSAEGSQRISASSTEQREQVTSRQGLIRTISRNSTRNPIVYKVYKRRFFGLVQLVLLNIIVSWDWLTFAPVSGTASQYFDVKESTINWLSTVFLFAFVAATPFTFYALAKHGPKASIVVSSCLLLVGNWIRYGGAKSNIYPVVVIGQLLIGFAQPFVLASPTTYSNVWFSAAGRTSATAVASLANPLGAALGQLISPFWATSPDQIPNTVLYTALISTAACVPAFFIPSRPPTPPGASATSSNTAATSTKSILNDLNILFHSPEFYLIFIPFSVLVGFFNAFSSLLNQFLSPYSFTEDDAGIAGALLIFVGLACAAISSPLIDRFKCYLWYIRVSVPAISVSYLVFVWAPATKKLAYVDCVCAFLGAASFGLVPVALEFVVEVHYPMGPEVGSSMCWSGGQLLGGIFIIIMDALKAGPNGDPPQEMSRALIFEAILAMVVVPLPLCLGFFGRKERVRLRRWEAEKRGADGDVVEEADVGVRSEGIHEEGS